MATLQHVDDVVLRNCEVVSAKPAEKKSDKSPDLIELLFKRRKWAPKKNKFISLSSVEDMELWVKLKVSREVFNVLKSLGLKPKSICDFEVANNGWATEKDSGTWYQFLGLLKIDGKEINYFIYQQSDDTSDFNSDWDNQIERELVEVGV
ncbi:MAG TPA: hypothetical protein DD379_09650 [Cyanobacteria bacterium UBA11162]|nr:hypothetical protein [Cyanobacteria bacterium UBA11162]